MKLTPLHIKILLHAHASFGTFEPWSDAAEEYSKQLEEIGAIQLHEEHLTIYTTTPLGEAWIAMILQTPPPRTAFLDQNGKEIEITKP